MLMTLEVLQAKKGDALLLHVGDEAAPALVVIDGGPRGVYNHSLRPRLEAIRGELDSRGRPRTGLPEEEALREAGGVTGVRAAAAGYRGPCGLDAFAFRSPEDGARIFRPLVEFNARFTMGIVVLGLVRRALPLVKETLAIEPGMRRAFLFAFIHCI